MRYRWYVVRHTAYGLKWKNHPTTFATPEEAVAKAEMITLAHLAEGREYARTEVAVFYSDKPPAVHQFSIVK